MFNLRTPCLALDGKHVVTWENPTEKTRAFLPLLWRSSACKSVVRPTFSRRSDPQLAGGGVPGGVDEGALVLVVTMVMSPCVAVVTVTLALVEPAPSAAVAAGAGAVLAV